jgi:hypothetical protein
LKRRLSVLLALVMMFSATAALAGPASAAPSGFVNGNHYGDSRNPDNGEHVGAGVGAGQYDNVGLYRRGLR